MVVEFGSGICLPDFKDAELKFVLGKKEFKSGKTANRIIYYLFTMFFASKRETVSLN